MDRILIFQESQTLGTGLKGMCSARIQQVLTDFGYQCIKLAKLVWNIADKKICYAMASLKFFSLQKISFQG